MRINVFLKEGGGFWADYETLKTHGPLLEHYVANTEDEIRQVIANPGLRCPERVQSLAQRALKELLQTPKELSPHLKEVKQRNFFGRLKFLFTGK